MLPDRVDSVLSCKATNAGKIHVGMSAIQKEVYPNRTHLSFAGHKSVLMRDIDAVLGSSSKSKSSLGNIIGGRHILEDKRAREPR